MLCCGRRFGKTALGTILSETAYKDALPFGWFSPTNKDALEVWRAAKFAFGPVTKSISEQYKRIDLNNGGIIEFWSLDDPDSGRGRKYKRVVIDEAAKVKRLEEAWQQSIRPTLTDYKGDALFLSTPKGLNYFYTLFEEAQDKEAWHTWQLPSTANPYLDPAEIEDARLDLHPLVYQQEYLAQFVKGAGFIFSDAHFYDSLPNGSYKEAWGFDGAYSEKERADYTVALQGRKYDDGRIYITKMLRFKKEPEGIPPILVANGVKAVTWIRSGTEKGAEALLESKGIKVNAITATNDKFTRMLPVAQAWNESQILLSKTVDEWQDIEIEATSFTGTKDDINDDILDALAALKQALDNPQMTDINKLKKAMGLR